MSRDRDNSFGRSAMMMGAGAIIGDKIGKPLGQTAYAMKVYGKDGNDITRKALKESLNPFSKKIPEQPPKGIIQKIVNFATKNTDTVEGIQKTKKYVGHIPERFMKDKKDVIQALNLKEKFLKGRGKAGRYGSFAGALGLGIFGAALEKNAGIPVANARGRRNKDGVANITSNVPKPSESTRPIITKKAMKTYMSKKRAKADIGNITRIGRLS